VVVLTEAAASGSTFSGWGGACSGSTSTCTVLLGSDEAVTATFTKNPPPSCSLKLVSGTVFLKSPKKHAGHPKPALGAMVLSITCNQSSTVTLTGAAKFTTKSAHGKGKKHTLTFTVHTGVTGGSPKTLTIKLPLGALSALRSHIPVAVTLSVAASNANGRATGSLTIHRVRTSG
jgi:hypothetical protein